MIWYNTMIDDDVSLRNVGHPSVVFDPTTWGPNGRRTKHRRVIIGHHHHDLVKLFFHEAKTWLSKEDSSWHIWHIFQMIWVNFLNSPVVWCFFWWSESMGDSRSLQKPLDQKWDATCVAVMSFPQQDIRKNGMILWYCLNWQEYRNTVTILIWDMIYCMMDRNWMECHLGIE